MLNTTADSNFVALESRFAYDSFRPGQKEFAQRVFEACIGGEVLVAEAMSGFGKTAAVLTGALSAAEEAGCKVVYACRTKRQIHRVVEEVARLQRKHPFGASSILSKFDYCLLRRQRPVPQESFGWYCSFHVSNNLCSYFLNVPLLTEDFDRIVDGALRTTPSHTELLRQSESAHICPYEVARLATIRAAVAAVPYNYVFDNRGGSVLFDQASLDRSKVMLVVDEAHNLRDFLRGVNSSSLTMEQVDGAIREAEAMLYDEAALSLRVLKETLEGVMQERSGWLLDRASVLERFRDERGTVWLQNLAFELTASSGVAWGSILYERRLPSLVLRVGEFLSKLSSNSRALLVKGEGTFGLIDPDPVGGLASYLREFRSAVLLSATVNPSPVFVRSLGLSASVVSTYEVRAEPTVEVKTVVDRGVSTRYKLRSPMMFSRISEKVAAIIEATGTGVGVFAPSYSVLGVLFENVSKRLPDRHMVTEAPGLSGLEAELIFESFRSGEGSTLFAVQGGRFSEGEDFNENLMGAVVVVGLSLPPPSPMLYAEYACLKRAGESDSYLMLSRLPALRKAFQAAGRHIRSPGKRGLIFFLDDRFGSEAVVALMPSWMRKDLLVGDFSPESLGSVTREFWCSKEGRPRPS